MRGPSKYPRRHVRLIPTIASGPRPTRSRPLFCGTSLLRDLVAVRLLAGSELRFPPPSNQAWIIFVRGETLGLRGHYSDMVSVGNRTVCVVEDEPITRMDAVLLLEEAGFEVKEFVVVEKGNCLPGE